MAEKRLFMVYSLLNIDAWMDLSMLVLESGIWDIGYEVYMAMGNYYSIIRSKYGGS